MAETVSIQELERRASDLIKVYNPTDRDFVVRWDSIPHRFPNKNRDIGHGPGCNIVPRYLAEHAAKHLTNNILLRRADEAVESENQRRVKSGMAEMTKFQEQLAFEKKFATNNPKLRAEIYREIWKGIVSVHGGNFSEDAVEDKSGPKTDEDIIRALEEGDDFVTGGSITDSETTVDLSPKNKPLTASARKNALLEGVE